MRKYFTLLEVILATTILAMMVAAVALGINGIFGSWNRITRANDKLERLLLMDRIVDSTFRNAIPFTWKDETRKDRFVFIGDDSELIVSYMHRINNADDGGINFLRLKLDGSNLVAEYRKTPILYWDDNYDNCTQEIILKSVSAISFLYADMKNDELTWLDDWDEDASVNIPLAIQIKVDFEDGSSDVWLRRTAGSGFRETFGVRKNNL